jgi:hypothetical protein
VNTLLLTGWLDRTRLTRVADLRRDAEFDDFRLAGEPFGLVLTGIYEDGSAVTLRFHGAQAHRFTAEPYVERLPGGVVDVLFYSDTSAWKRAALRNGVNTRDLMIRCRHYQLYLSNVGLFECLALDCVSSEGEA